MRSLFLVSIFTVCCALSYAQQAVRGTVKDEFGTPLAGVSIRQQTISVGTVTDENGSFSLVLDASADPSLSFSMVGFRTEELNVKGLNTVDIIMTSQGIDLEQVIVVGYGQQKKATVTGAISSVTS